MKVTVENLLHGSSEINRMRHEIDLIVGLMWSQCPRPTIGAVTPFNVRSAPKPVLLEVPNGLMWRLQFYPIAGLSAGVSLTISAFIREYGRDELVYSHNSENSSKLASWHVQTVHASLQGFLDALLNRYPEIEERVDYLLAAAE